MKASYESVGRAILVKHVCQLVLFHGGHLSHRWVSEPLPIIPSLSSEGTALKQGVVRACTTCFGATLLHQGRLAVQGAG